ncbi:hypothetical protein D3C84_563350 [compost metagenome]
MRPKLPGKKLRVGRPACRFTNLRSPLFQGRYADIASIIPQQALEQLLDPAHDPQVLQIGR